MFQKNSDKKMRKYPFKDLLLSRSSSSSQRTSPQSKLECMRNVIDEALHLLHPNQDFEDSSSSPITMVTDPLDPIAIQDADDGILMNDLKNSGILMDTLGGAVNSAQGETKEDDGEEETAHHSSLNPFPILPYGIQVVNEIPFGSSWNLINDPLLAADIIKVMSTTEQEQDVSHIISSPPLGFSSPPVYIDKQSPERNEVPPRPQSLVERTTNKKTGVQGGSLPNSDKWNERLQELVQFRNEFGHCLCPNIWEGNPALAQWIKRQRYQFKLSCKGLPSTLTRDRISALEEVGFIWNSHDAIWEERLHELEDFLNQHGHCNVPSRYKANPQLSIWVRSQRRQYKLRGRGIILQEEYEMNRHKNTKTNLPRPPPRHSMTNERLQKLQSLGFVFTPRRGC